MAFTTRETYGDEGLGSISGTAATLPVGVLLGEERYSAGVFYRCMFNAGNSQIIPGFIGSPKALASGAFSVTITTTSDGAHALGAGVVQHSTVPTGFYGWFAFRGYPVKLSAGTSSVATGGRLMVGPSGNVTTMVTAVTGSAVDPNANNYCIGVVIDQAYSGVASTTTGQATVMTLVGSGDSYISFPDYVF